MTNNMMVYKDGFMVKRNRVEFTKRLIINDVKRFAIILAMVVVALAIGIGYYMAKAMIFLGNDYIPVEKYDNMVAKYETKIATMQSEFDHSLAVNKETIQRQSTTIDTLKSEYNKAIAIHKEDMAAFNTKAVALARKYWYVFRDYKPNSTITFNDLDYVEMQAKKEDINPHVIINMWDLESEWNTNSKNRVSSARGFGNFLGSTGKWVYNGLLKRPDKYVHAKMAHDPKVNTDMTVAYLSYLLKEQKGDIKGALIGYNGNELGPKYYNIINNKMKKAGVGDITHYKYYNNKFNTVM